MSQTRVGGESDPEAARRGVSVRTLRADANAVDPFGKERYDLVSLQYGSFHRTPDQRGLRSLLEAVAVGGTLLVIAHDLTWARSAADPAEQTRMFDPEAYVGVEEIAAVVSGSPLWRVDVLETRPRPSGASSSQHVEDVVLRAVRLQG